MGEAHRERSNLVDGQIPNEVHATDAFAPSIALRYLLGTKPLLKVKRWMDVNFKLRSEVPCFVHLKAHYPGFGALMERANKYFPGPLEPRRISGEPQDINARLDPLLMMIASERPPSLSSLHLGNPAASYEEFAKQRYDFASYRRTPRP